MNYCGEWVPIESSIRHHFWYWDRFQIPKGVGRYLLMMTPRVERNKYFFLTRDEATTAFNNAVAMARAEGT